MEFAIDDKVEVQWKNGDKAEGFVKGFNEEHVEVALSLDMELPSRGNAVLIKIPFAHDMVHKVV